MTTRAPWTARCKSGYTFADKACKRPTPRGALLCSDCLHAEHLPAPASTSVVRLVLAAAAAWLGVR
jgi:hypothetical protein